MTCSYETERIGEDRERLARNPEVAGSNPVPATTVPATSVPATNESGLDQAKRSPASAGGRFVL